MNFNRRVFLRQVGWGAAGAGFLPLWPGGMRAQTATGAGLPRSTPEAEGVSTAGILAFLDAIAAAKHELHSCMLVRHGRVVAEGWWAPYGPAFNHTLYSLSKSFTSTAVGFAVAEGRLKVTDRVVSFFPEEVPASVSDHLAALRVRDLLTMSVGHEKEPNPLMVAQQNWVRTFLAQPLVNRPGTVFLYSSAATYLCSAIVQQLTGQRVSEYLTPRLFAPLGITGATWETCPLGRDTGGWGLSVPTEALAKFGQFLLQQGRWNGRQLLPAAWIEEATGFQIQQTEPAKHSRPDWFKGYGYQFWRCRHDAFRGDGAYGQFMVVMPKQDAVVAITAETSNMQGVLDQVWEHLLPAMQPQPLAADPTAQATLRRRLAGLALALPEGATSSPLAAKVAGRVFGFEPNELGLESAQFEFARTAATVRFRAAGREHVITGGVAAWERGETGLPGTPPRLIPRGASKSGVKEKAATAVAWRDESTLEWRLRFYETAHHDTILCRFGTDTLEVSFLSSLAKLRGGKEPRPVLQGRVGT